MVCRRIWSSISEGPLAQRCSTTPVASGLHACSLHYNTNHGCCEDGQILLLDAAAKYANYNADLTRSIPVNGRFTPRQRAVYAAVLGVFRASCELLRPGVLIREYQEKVGELMTEALIGLGLLDGHAIAIAHHWLGVIAQALCSNTAPRNRKR